jgi:integrase
MYPHYLYKNKSNTSYFFLSYIPLDIRHLFDGRIKFLLSLKCGNKVISKKICLHLNKQIETIYEQIRMGQSLTIDEMKRILKKEIEKSKKHSSFFSYVGVDRSKERTKQEGLERLQREEIELKSRKKTDFDDEVEKLLKDEGITDTNRKSGTFRVFRENFIKIQNLKIKWKREIINGETKAEFDLVSKIIDGEEDDLLGEIIDKKDAFARRTHLQPVIENYAPEPIEPYLAETKLIRDVVDEFLDLRKGTIGEKMLDEYKVITDEFIEIVGNIPVSTLSKDSIRTYISTQIKLPPSRRKNPKYREMSIVEVMKLKGVKPQSRINVNKFLTRLTTFMNFGVSQGYIKENYILGMKIPIPKTEGRKKREPFSPEDLVKILHPKTYLDYTIDFGKTTKSRKPNVVKYQNSFYWAFLIGIFSGMRTNETAQLRIEDIIKKENVWMISIDETEGKSVKTTSSIRKVPVHPTLISLGFIDYVKIIKSKGVDRVFPELTKQRDGYSTKISQHYNEKFLPSIGVWKRQVKVLYSTRHTFINRCYKKGVDRDIIKSIVGHEPDFTMDVYGGNPFTTKQLYQGISKVSYSNIKWNRIKVDWKKLIG